jgi:sugar lactone lactonase YvrE
MRNRAALLLLLVGLCLIRVCIAAEPAPKAHQAYRAEAMAAYGRKDFAAAKEAFAAALKLRPDSPRYLYNLAALSALLGDEAGALRFLQQLAKLGVYLPAQKDPDFASLQGKPAFVAAIRALTDNREPRGQADVLGELSGRSGIIEGIAYRERTGDLFFGDVHHRCIWKRDVRGQVTRFTADDDELFGVFGIAVDERRGTLWAATTALPEMAGFEKPMKGHGALAEFNLQTSELRRVIPLPSDGRDHHLGDLMVTPDGTVYASDSAAPVIWSFTPGAEEIEKLVESPEFASLQGIILLNRHLVVSDYANGLFVIDPASRGVRALAPPSDTTLLGLDGLVAIPGGLVATQNGIEPQRVVRLTLNAELTEIKEVKILASGLANFEDLTLITLANDRPTLIANSGWDGFDPAKAQHPAGHTVRIFQVPLQ